MLRTGLGDLVSVQTVAVSLVNIYRISLIPESMVIVPLQIRAIVVKQERTTGKVIVLPKGRAVYVEDLGA